MAAKDEVEPSDFARYVWYTTGAAMHKRKATLIGYSPVHENYVRLIDSNIGSWAGPFFIDVHYQCISFVEEEP